MPMGFDPDELIKLMQSATAPIPPTPMPASKSKETFKEGDIIRVFGSRAGNYLTDEATVLKVDYAGYVYYRATKGPHAGNVNYCNPRDCELVKPKASKPAAPKKLDFSHLDALVIDATVKEEIVSVLKQHQNHGKLFDEWGLGEVIEYGRGMTFMFYGPPGTGKTWGAHCIAKALGQELLIIGQAEIQSSEPGAANRNIQDAFRAAKEEGKVLFIDECDSLITNRADLGMVLAGEVNTILTEIEKSEGVVILATNRIEHMDEALERRISLIAEFPHPDEAARQEIWLRMLPKKLPLGKDVSIEELAAHSLTGGQIKNAVLQAARLALAADCKKVEKRHFDIAIERIRASKNLMGTASRYHQRPVDDMQVARGVGRDVRVDVTRSKKRFTDFLKEESGD
jgi:AAA+ superfamily predicted ATPase